MSTVTEAGELIATTARECADAVVGVGRGWRAGTGTVIAPDRVLTAAYNVGEGVTVTTAGGERREAEVAGLDRELGIAVVAAQLDGAAPLRWADPAEAALGDPVVAMANPGGRGMRATLGFVASTDRSLRGPRGLRLRGAVEHTAPLPRGSAGGPLLDESRAVVGINLARVEGGLVLALSAAALRGVADRLAEGEEIERPRLGLAVAPPFVARRMRRAVGLSDRPGVLVRAVDDDGPGARAGLERGDLLVAADGGPLDGVDTLHRALAGAGRSGPLRLTVVRGDEERVVEVDLDGDG